MTNLSEYVSFVDGFGNIVDTGNYVVNVTTHTLGYVEAFVFSFIILLAAIFVHELFHLYVLQKCRIGETVFAYVILKKIRLGKIFIPTFKIHTGIEEQYEDLQPKQKIDVYMSGILGGLLVVLCASMFHPFYFLLLGPYFVGCFGDFQKSWRNFKLVRKK